MLDINVIARFAENYGVPLEDVLFIALNTNGVNLEWKSGRFSETSRFWNKVAKSGQNQVGKGATPVLE